MTVYVVQYHDNSWGAQESSDEILGVYSSNELATKRADEFEQEYAYHDDIVSILAYELDEDVGSMKECGY